jgi:hypothetical protein
MNVTPVEPARRPAGHPGYGWRWLATVAFVCTLIAVVAAPASAGVRFFLGAGGAYGFPVYAPPAYGCPIPGSYPRYYPPYAAYWPPAPVPAPVWGVHGHWAWRRGPWGRVRVWVPRPYRW